MKKLSTILMLPLIAIMLFAGCGKTDRTANEMVQLMNKTVETYNYKVSDTVTKNWLFATGADGKQSKIMEVQFAEAKKESSDVGLNTLIQSSSSVLDNRYALLKETYQVELYLVFTYYNYYENSFFANIESKDVNKDQMRNLYDKMIDYKNQLIKFVDARENLERNVALFGCNSSILTAKIDAFYYDYNQLISKSLNFVKYFRDMHKQYFYSDPELINEDYATRLYYDCLLTLSDFVYNDIFKSLSKNSTVQLNYIKNDEFNTVVFNNVYFKNLISGYKLKSIDEALLNNLRLNDKNSDNFTAAVNTVKQVEIELRNFNQYYALYKKCYNNINFNDHNSIRFNMQNLNNSGESYYSLIKNKSEEEQSNYQVIFDVEAVKTWSFLKAINLFI